MSNINVTCNGAGNKWCRPCGKVFKITRDNLFLTELNTESFQGNRPTKFFVSFECECGAVSDLKEANWRDKKKYPTYLDWTLNKNGPNRYANHAMKINKFSHVEKESKVKTTNYLKKIAI